MKSFKKTYKYISALTLIFFLSSVVLPAGISAASLFCEMDMADMNNSFHTCCDFHHLNLSHAFTKDKDKESCTYLEVCPHMLSKEQTDIQAISQISKDIVVAFVTDELFAFSDRKQQLNRSNKISSAPKHSPPIFLLNSTFLN